jgi:3-oxoacyl-[acyl-carrier-protein] synthase II
MTHCNSGALAASGRGTGLGVIAELADRREVRVLACEARPLLQGARLTVWELRRLGIAHDLLVDAAAPGLIRTGEVDAVVTGGAEAGLTPLAQAAFESMGATSPSGISRPFDARRDGFVMGEGAGVLVLESEESARERDQAELGEVLGFGASSDAHHLTAPQPEGSGASRAILRALDDAGIEPGDVDYINAHGTSTPLNDRAETRAIETALGDAAERVPVSSTKSVIGHLLGAAGAVEAIAAILALYHRSAPPTINLEDPDDDVELNVATNGPRTLPDGPIAALNNSFGFGGHNVALAFRTTG